MVKIEVSHLRHFWRRHPEQFLAAEGLRRQMPEFGHVGLVFLSGTRLQDHWWLVISSERALKYSKSLTWRMLCTGSMWPPQSENLESKSKFTLLEPLNFGFKLLSSELVGHYSGESPLFSCSFFSSSLIAFENYTHHGSLFTYQSNISQVSRRHPHSPESHWSSLR